MARSSLLALAPVRKRNFDHRTCSKKIDQAAPEGEFWTAEQRQLPRSSEKFVAFDGRQKVRSPGRQAMHKDLGVRSKYERVLCLALFQRNRFVASLVRDPNGNNRVEGTEEVYRGVKHNPSRHKIFKRERLQ